MVNKTVVFLLVLVAFAMIVSVSEAATRVEPCDQVCSRIDPEKDECCRAHGHSSWAHCNGGMHCYGAATRVGPCDQVCSRIDPEKNECCRAHGHSSWAHCNGGMHCYG